ncbi:MAG TPA: helix-turn-helix transcriptional regulator [Candidatus Sulfotelmatobacter sp.]|jgi:transcriptional regulator with XRE-family HTH domain|nr:helix-turn-helix transcriptional regulator [Candidatus Sulfotelmatobacter sp.]
MSDTSDALRVELRDPEFSEGYAESFLNSYVATQIKVIREQRQMKQSDLAREVGTTQTAISRIENVNYSSWNINTLKKLARAFRVRLRVSFETYGTLPDEVGEFTQKSLQRAEREKDPGLLERKPPHGEEVEQVSTMMAFAMGAPTTTRDFSTWHSLMVMPRPESQVPTIPQTGGLNASQGSFNG